VQGVEVLAAAPPEREMAESAAWGGHHQLCTRMRTAAATAAPAAHDEAAVSDEEMASSDWEKLQKEEAKLDAPQTRGRHDIFNHDEYVKEWHKEWSHGAIPAFRDRYPQVKKYEDRQSDGKASKVPSGLR